MSKMMKAVLMRGMNALHLTLMGVAVALTWFRAFTVEVGPQDMRTVGIAVGACYLAVTFFFYRTYDAYKIGMYRAGETFYAQTLANLFSDGITFFFACLIQLRPLNAVPMLQCFAVQTAISAVWVLADNQLYFKLHEPMKTLVIYRREEDLQKVYEITHLENRFDIRSKCKSTDDVFELLPQMKEYQAVIVSGVEATMRNGIVKECIEKDVDCFFIPHVGDVIIAGARHVQSFSVPIMEARRAMPKPEYAAVKRLMDVAFSLGAFIVASPLMAVTALVIRGYDHGPALYKQVRLTKDGRQFEILKFRSMRVDAEKDGVARLACDHDDRITPVGKVIRAVRFDELPQLINILKGDMSIVGPRPERPEIAAQYEKEMPAFSLRLQVKAGLTGTAQVYGRYNTEPRDKLKMDLMYINRMSLREDLKLIFATVKILFMKDSTAGVQDGQVTAENASVPRDKSA